MYETLCMTWEGWPLWLVGEAGANINHLDDPRLDPKVVVFFWIFGSRGGHLSIGGEGGCLGGGGFRR